MHLKRMGLLQIKGIGKTSEELLEAVGITLIRQLADSEPGKLHAELALANERLKITGQAPRSAAVEKWVREAKDFGEVPLDHPPAEDRVEAEGEVENLPEKEEPAEIAAPESPSVSEMSRAESGALEKSDWDLALPLPSNILVSQGIRLQDVPEARVIPRPMRGATTSSSAGPRTGQAVVKSLGNRAPVSPDRKVEDDPADTDDRTGEVDAPPVSTLPPVREREFARTKSEGPTELVPRGRHITTTVKQGTNEGRSAHSRTFIRGVLYPRAALLRISALIVIANFILVPLSIFGSIVVLMRGSLWWLVCPALLLIFGFFYLFTATRPRCRICGQSIFVSKSCHRHVKAHHVPFLGYILPTALHLLFFRWFRCIYCGTAVRTKE